jgi:hypothetical protein
VRYASLFERLCAHIEIDDLYPFCWHWIGPTRRHGGGRRPALSMRVPGGGQSTSPKQRNACRVMCEVIHGPPPDGAEASHLCDENWCCVNPDHLIWESKQENLKRRDARLRDERAMDLTIPMPKWSCVDAPF